MSNDHRYNFDAETRMWVPVKPIPADAQTNPAYVTCEYEPPKLIDISEILDPALLRRMRGETPEEL